MSKTKSAQSRDGRLCRRETWIGTKFDFRLPSPRRKRLVLKFPTDFPQRCICFRLWKNLLDALKRTNGCKLIKAYKQLSCLLSSCLLRIDHFLCALLSLQTQPRNMHNIELHRLGSVFA